MKKLKQTLILAGSFFALIGLAVTIHATAISVKNAHNWLYEPFTYQIADVNAKSQNSTEFQATIEAIEVFNDTEVIIREIARKQDFKWEDYLVRLAFCESTLNPYAKNINTGGSIDRGVFQINSKWHSEVPDDCAYDIYCATDWAIERIMNGYQHEWVCDDKI